MDITNNPFGIHERALQARGQRMELLAAYGKAAADYQATLSFIQDTGSSIKRALRGE